MDQPTVILVSVPPALSEWCEPAVMRSGRTIICLSEWCEPAVTQSGRTIICNCVVTTKKQPQLESSVYLIS